MIFVSILILGTQKNWSLWNEYRDYYLKHLKLYGRRPELISKVTYTINKGEQPHANYIYQRLPLRESWGKDAILSF